MPDIEDDSYVVCTQVGDYGDVLKVGGKYHVEESFNIRPENNVWGDPRGVASMLAKYPNPFFYLKEVNDLCPCCGERLFFCHTFFKTKAQTEDQHGSLEEIAQKSGDQGQNSQVEFTSKARESDQALQ